MPIRTPYLRNIFQRFGLAFLDRRLSLILNQFISGANIRSDTHEYILMANKYFEKDLAEKCGLCWVEVFL